MASSNNATIPTHLSNFEEFCGGVFWDNALTWYTDMPDFTACFHKSVFSWTPAAVLFLYAPIEARKYLRSTNRNIPYTWLNLTKMAVTVGLIAVAVAEVIFSLTADDSKTNDIDYVTPVVFLLSYLLSLFMLLLSLRYGKHTQPCQFFFYLLSTVCSIPILPTLVKRQNDPPPHDYSKWDPMTADLGRLTILWSFQFSFVTINFVLNCIADSKPKVYNEKYERLTRPCPQITASYASKLYYFWADKLLWTGYRNPLEPKDLWQVNPKYTSRGVLPEFDKNYAKTVKEAEKAGKKHSIYPALFWTFGPMFFVGSCQKLVYDLLAMVAPQIMNLMIDYVESYALGSDEPAWKGYFYAGFLLTTQCVQTVILSQYFERMFLVGMNLRTALISVIYRKSLKITSEAKRESSLGESVNLMSVDVQRFMDLLPYINMLWSAPLQIGLCCYFIYQELGAAMFAGLGLMILAVPFNAVFASFTRKFQLEQMKNKDERVKLMNEILGGVKVLKLYGWEGSFIDQVLGIRSKEIKVLKKIGYLSALINFIWVSIPFLVTLVCFTTYIFMDGGNVLTADKAFVTLSYLNIMRMPMSMLPFLIIGLVQVGVSLERVNKYMNNEELSESAVSSDPADKDAISVSGGTFKWAKEEKPVLSDIDIRVPEGSLTAVVGTVGAGKSSLVSALLGEMEKDSGRINVRGSVAYVPQQAWMQNATLENNILFSKAKDEKKYERVIEACALRSDIDILPGGDQTEIGEKGINLSGGQKQRVSLARAVYSGADVYLLDDPLSAVDSHVGKHIFEEVVGHDGLLRSKTRLLVTHGITYLPFTDQIIVIKNGTVSEQGTYQELLRRKGDFADFLLEYMAEEGTGEGQEEGVEEIKQQLEETLGKDQVNKELMRKASVVSQGDQDGEARPELQRQVTKASAAAVPAALQQQLSNVTSMSDDKKEEDGDEKEEGAAAGPKAGATIIEKEVAETGSVSWEVYGYYLRAVGITGAVLVVGMQLLYQGMAIGTNVWLEVWTDNQLGPSNETYYRNLYLGVYGAFGFAQAFATMILSIVLAITTLNASKALHKVMLGRVMRAPMSFFDTTPLGRIVNRFAKDVDVCDNTLPQNLRSWLSTLAGFIGTVILIIVKLPIFTAVIVPISVVFYFVQNVYVNTSRQLKRLESISRSPIYSHFGETIQGSSTIRAFGLQEKFINESEEKVDANQVCYYPSIIANRWLAVRLEYMGNLITFSTALFTIISPDSISPSDVGLVISYALNVTQTLNWLVRMTSDVETNIVAVERIKEYSQAIDQEADWERGESKPSKDWPQEGSVQFDEFAMRYRPGLDLVVKHITCDIKGGETVGIVGRTGAGKSSLTVALFRLVEAAEGTITIDGEDISKLALHDLRRKLTIIPQDPVLFSGTLRINLDPFSLHSDAEVWKALELAHLKEFATGLENGLEHEVSEGGDNVSVGQRQLICLARALLRKTKVLILDEATAAVDLETDDLIQATIRKEFKGCTVITIAHRLNTIMDYDRILVLDKGRIKEFDSPARLLEDPATIFHRMAKDANLV